MWDRNKTAMCVCVCVCVLIKTASLFLLADFLSVINSNFKMNLYK